MAQLQPAVARESSRRATEQLRVCKGTVHGSKLPTMSVQARGDAGSRPAGIDRPAARPGHGADGAGSRALLLLRCARLPGGHGGDRSAAVRHPLGHAPVCAGLLLSHRIVDPPVTRPLDCRVDGLVRDVAWCVADRARAHGHRLRLELQSGPQHRRRHLVPGVGHDLRGPAVAGAAAWSRWSSES